jgi:hypothetical protein
VINDTIAFEARANTGINAQRTGQKNAETTVELTEVNNIILTTAIITSLRQLPHSNISIDGCTPQCDSWAQAVIEISERSLQAHLDNL